MGTPHHLHSLPYPSTLHTRDRRLAACGWCFRERETAAERWSLLAATGGAVATLSRSSVGLPLGTVATSVAYLGICEPPPMRTLSPGYIPAVIITEGL